MTRIAIAFLVLMTAVTAVGNAVLAKPVKARAQAVEETAPEMCKPGAWRMVNRDVIDQAAALIKQFDAANDQLAKLGAAGEDVVTISRRAPSTGYKVYEGSWNEVREALRTMLSRRLDNLSCRLQALGVDMKRSAAAQVARSAAN